MVSNIIVLIGAGLIGWFLAGEPTNIKELKHGIGHLMGSHDDDRGGGFGDMGIGGAGMMPYGGMIPPMTGTPTGGQPPGSDPQVQALQQQMQQQQQQAQMQQMQQQFTDQMSQQQAQAQQAQLQQQIQQMQAAQQQQAAAAAGGMGSAAAAGAAGAPNAGATSPITSPATATPSTADAAQQMLPSATPPGIVPGTQNQYGQPPSTPGSPYDPNSYAGSGGYGAAAGGMLGGMPALPGGPPPFGYGGVYPPPTHMIDNLFAGHFAPPLGPINIEAPLRAIPNSGYFHGLSPYAAFNKSYSVARQMGARAHLGIVDEEHSQRHERPRPFFHGYHDLMMIELGHIIPGLDGVTLGDLIASTDSGTGNEIFPNGIDKMNMDTFMNDITRYIHRILRNMTGKSPDDKMRILRELILAAAETKGISALNPIPPNVVTYQNTLSSVPRRNIPDIIPVPNGPRYRNHEGFHIPDKYAALQFKGGNSMPPMIRRGRGGFGGGDDGHSLFFNLNER